jgi:hypothetical protein
MIPNQQYEDRAVTCNCCGNRLSCADDPDVGAVCIECFDNLKAVHDILQMTASCLPVWTSNRTKPTTQPENN